MPGQRFNQSRLRQQHPVRRPSTLKKVADLAELPLPQPGPGAPAEVEGKMRPITAGNRPLTAPNFYLTSRQPLRPSVIIFAALVAVGSICIIAYALGRGGHARLPNGGESAARNAGAAGGATPADDDKDDPSQVDVIALGDPADAPTPAHRGDHYSSVHPTILIHLPRFGERVGLIPDTPSGHLLYGWLAAFNQARPSALAGALPNGATASTVAAQIDLRQQTGGFELLSAKEIEPGILVFRLRDQTPLAGEVLGTLQMRPKSDPAEIGSFSLRAIPPTLQDAATGAGSRLAVTPH